MDECEESSDSPSPRSPRPKNGLIQGKIRFEKQKGERKPAVWLSDESRKLAQASAGDVLELGCLLRSGEPQLTTGWASRRRVDVVAGGSGTPKKNPSKHTARARGTRSATDSREKPVFRHHRDLGEYMRAYRRENTTGYHPAVYDASHSFNGDGRLKSAGRHGSTSEHVPDFVYRVVDNTMSHSLEKGPPAAVVGSTFASRPGSACSNLSRATTATRTRLYANRPPPSAGRRWLSTARPRLDLDMGGGELDSEGGETGGELVVTNGDMPPSGEERVVMRPNTRVTSAVGQVTGIDLQARLEEALLLTRETLPPRNGSDRPASWEQTNTQARLRLSDATEQQQQQQLNTGASEQERSHSPPITMLMGLQVRGAEPKLERPKPTLTLRTRSVENTAGSYGAGEMVSTAKLTFSFPTSAIAEYQANRNSVRHRLLSLANSSPGSQGRPSQADVAQHNTDSSLGERDVAFVEKMKERVYVQQLGEDLTTIPEQVSVAFKPKLLISTRSRQNRLK